MRRTRSPTQTHTHNPTIREHEMSLIYSINLLEEVLISDLSVDPQFFLSRNFSRVSRCVRYSTHITMKNVEHFCVNLCACVRVNSAFRNHTRKPAPEPRIRSARCESPTLTVDFLNIAHARGPNHHYHDDTQTGGECKREDCLCYAGEKHACACGGVNGSFQVCVWNARARARSVRRSHTLSHTHTQTHDSHVRLNRESEAPGTHSYHNHTFYSDHKCIQTGFTLWNMWVARCVVIIRTQYWSKIQIYKIHSKCCAMVNAQNTYMFCIAFGAHASGVFHIALYTKVHGHSAFETWCLCTQWSTYKKKTDVYEESIKIMFS